MGNTLQIQLQKKSTRYNKVYVVMAVQHLFHGKNNNRAKHSEDRDKTEVLIGHMLDDADKIVQARQKAIIPRYQEQF